MTPPRCAVRWLTLALFRSWPRLDLTDLDAPDRPPFIAIYGPNGAGKTNLIEAVSLLSPGRGLRGASGDALARRPDSAGWRVTAEVDSPAGAADLQIGADAQGRRPALLGGKPARSAAVAACIRMIWLTPAHDRLFADSPGARRRFLDRATLSLFPHHGEDVLTYDKAMRDRNRLLKEGRFDPHWLGALETEMATAGARISQRRGETAATLQAAQTGDAFPRATLTLRGAAPEDAVELRAALAEGRRRDAAAGRTLIGPHVSDLDVVYAAKATPAALCSTGEQKALLISAVLANARAIAAQTGAAPILLLDEIAAHFDPDRRAALYAELRAVGAQTWMTGAEAALFADLPAGSLQFAVSDDGGASRLRGS